MRGALPLRERELLQEPLDDREVEVLAAQHRIATGGLHLELHLRTAVGHRAGDRHLAAASFADDIADDGSVPVEGYRAGGVRDSVGHI